MIVQEPTPTGVRVFAFLPSDLGGVEVEVTEGVKTLYDIVLSSLDWGSGMVTIEDAEAVVHIAKVCGLPMWEEAERYVRTQTHSDEQGRFIKDNRLQKLTWLHGGAVEHDHVFSSVGRCMWPMCEANG